MNVKNLFAAVTLLAATGSVFANDLLPFTELDNFKSSTTRADVKAAVIRDRKDTALVYGDFMPTEQTATAPTGSRTRTAVRQEAIESAKNQKAHAKDDIGG